MRPDARQPSKIGCCVSGSTCSRSQTCVGNSRSSRALRLQLPPSRPQKCWPASSRSRSRCSAALARSRTRARFDRSAIAAVALVSDAELLTVAPATGTACPPPPSARRHASACALCSPAATLAVCDAAAARRSRGCRRLRRRPASRVRLCAGRASTAAWVREALGPRTLVFEPTAATVLARRHRLHVGRAARAPLRSLAYCRVFCVCPRFVVATITQKIRANATARVASCRREPLQNNLPSSSASSSPARPARC